MMRRSLFCLGVVFLLSCNLADSRQMAPAASAPLVKVTDHSAEELIDKYVTAIGGRDKWRAIHSVRLTGKFLRPGIPPAPITIEKKRPNQMLRRLHDRDLISQGRDGDSLWEIFPPTGVTKPSPMNPSREGYFRHWAAIDPPLLDYRAKGTQVELLGKEKTGAKEIYVLQATFKDGETARFYLDGQSHLLVKAVERRTLGGQASDAEIVWSDLRPLGGVLWAYSETTTLKAMNIPQTIHWDKIEINPALEDGDFKMPKG